MSSTPKVLDSYSLIAYLEDEKGADKVGELIKQANDLETILMLSLVNWGELYYVVYRTAGKEAAQKALDSLDTLPIQIIPPDREVTKIAGELKATRKMSYADCFAAALAKQKKADLVTGDKEFRQVENVVKIVWI